MSKHKATKQQRRIDKKPPVWTNDEVEEAARFTSKTHSIILKAFRNPDTSPALRDEAAKRILKARADIQLRKPGHKERVSPITLDFLERVAKDIAEQAMDLYQLEMMDRHRVNPRRRAEIARGVMVDFLVESLGEPDKKAEFSGLPIGTQGYNRFRLKNDLLDIITGLTRAGRKTAKRRAR